MCPQIYWLYWIVHTIEYVQENDYVDVNQLLDKYENLIVTKSFSKIQGLAAIRLGCYGLSNAS